MDSYYVFKYYIMRCKTAEPKIKSAGAPPGALGAADPGRIGVGRAVRSGAPHTARLTRQTFACCQPA